MGKLFLTIILIMILVTRIYALEQETRVKFGYNTVMCEPITAGPVVALSYQARYKWFALEPALSFMTNRISQVGRMYIAEPSITAKIYIHNIYLGGGLGYYFNTIIEYFGNQADLDDEVSRFGVVGVEFPHAFIELRGTCADLDLESGLPFEPEIEHHSRYDNFQILIGKRFKF